MPPSLLSDEATIATNSGSLKTNAELSLKTVHMIIYCPHTDLTYEGRVLTTANACSSSPRANTSRKKKKDAKEFSSPSSTSSDEGIQYIKHGKGTIHNHASGMTLSGYFQQNQLVGHALQTLYDPSGGHILAQYEGSFRNDGAQFLRHGKGKFMWHTTNDVYFGEFQLGDMEGIGTFTWGHSGDRYEGPFKRGRMHGSSGKKYTFLTGDVFKGAWRKGQAHGWGRKDFGNGDVFQGCYSRDVRQGYGYYQWQNGDIYIGQWSEGSTSGRGLKILVKDPTETNSPFLEQDSDHAHNATEGAQSQGHISEVYQGEWDCDEAQGNGVKRYSNGDVYIGSFEISLRNGYGVYTWSNGDVYEGYFVNGCCQGQGIKRLANGDVLDGEWFEDKIHGYGVKTHARNGDIHMGSYHEDERDGHGLYKWANGNEYEGDFSEGDIHGFGEFRWESSLSAYRGEWQKGRKNGPGFLRILVRGVERVIFDIYRLGSRLSREAMTCKWDDIPTLNQLKSKKICLEELKRKHFIPQI